MSVSASKSALLLSPCLRWTWDEAKAYEDEFADTTKRDRGTLFHAAMDRYYTDPEKWLKVCAHDTEVTGWVRDAIVWSRAHLEPRCQSILSEVYVAYEFSTGQVHTDCTVHDRKYPDMPGYLPGTTDLVCLLADGSLLVADWKTGGGTGADKQLLTLALGLREVFRLPSGELRKVLLSVLYAGENGVRPHEWEATNEDLEAHKMAMGLQLMDVGVRTEPVPGPHCHNLYCPHLAYCPGITGIVLDASEGTEALLPASALTRRYDMCVPTSDTHAGYVMSRVTSAKRQLDYLSSVIKKHLASGGRCIAGDIEYSNGRDGHRWRPQK